LCFVGVLDEEDDVLMNVNIVDSEKAVKNVENKKNARANPYDQQEEMDEFGNVSCHKLFSLSIISYTCTYIIYMIMYVCYLTGKQADLVG